MPEATAPPPPSFASLVQQFFTEYLVTQRALSPRTIASYRDALMLFLDFAHQRLGKPPTALRLADFQPDLILAFLDHLEQQRHNTVRSRNLRLTALRAFLKFAARRDLSSLYVIERALGVPMKRFERPMLGFLSREEMLAVMGEPGSTWTSQRDHLLLAMLYNTGARVSEIIGVRVADVVLDGPACVHLRGKGRKQRSVPLWKTTVQEVRAWLRRNPTLGGGAALLPNRNGQAMTRANVNQRLDIAVARASKDHSSLAKRSISPHSIRHYLPFLTMSSDAHEIIRKSLSRGAGMLDQTPDIVFSTLQTIQEGKQLVSRLIAPWSAARRGGLGKGLLLHRQCRVEIDLRGLHRFVSEPQCNHRTINACLEKVHGHGVPQAVNGHALLSQRRANFGCRHAMLGQQVLHAMDAERFTLGAGKEHLAITTLRLSHPGFQPAASKTCR
jgi:site-specific recombinase XerD